MRFTTTIVVLVFGLGAAGVAADKSEGKRKSVKISTADTSEWGEYVGEWKVVSSVKLDEKDRKRFALAAGKGVLVNGNRGHTQNVFSTYHHGDVQAHIEFMVPQGSNSGVYFQGRYEVQVFDSWGKKKPGFGDCGGIYQRWGPKGGYEGHGPRQNASLPPGEWQSFDVTFRAPRFDKDGKKIANAVFVKVIHNGKVVHENVEVTGSTRAAGFRDEKPTGPLMLQGDHGPVAYRNLRLTGVVTRPSSKDRKPLKWIQASASKPAPKSLSGPITMVLFENRSGRSVKIYWVSPDGTHRLYGELSPGGTRKQKTYGGNTWLITDKDDKPLGHFIAEPLASRAVIPKR
jgi:hypothetical protein